MPPSFSTADGALFSVPFIVPYWTSTEPSVERIVWKVTVAVELYRIDLVVLDDEAAVWERAGVATPPPPPSRSSQKGAITAFGVAVFGKAPL